MPTKTKKRRLLAIILTGAMFFQFAFAFPAQAAANSIYISPSTQTVTKDQVFTVSVGVSTSSNVDTVQANLSYPSSQMMFQDVSYSGSVFGTSVEWVGGGGSIRIGRSSASAVSGDHAVAVLTFKAVATSGTGTISVLNTSSLADGGTPVSAQYGSAAIDFGKVAAAPKAAASSQTPSVVTKLSNLVTIATIDITPPILSDVRSDQAVANSQIITWKTNEPSTTKVEYGVDNKYGLTVSDSALTTTHKVTLKSAFLLPNQLFHYRVTSVDPSSNSVVSTDLVFKTLGVSYIVTVRDIYGKPLPHAAVTINGQTVATDGNGKASLPSSAGPQLVTVSYHGISKSKTVDIAADKLQQMDSVKLAAQLTLIDGRYVIYPLLIVFGLLLGLASRAHLLKYPLAILRRGKTRFLNMPISKMQMEFGDINPAHNPYQAKRLFSFWGIENFFVRLFQRPSKKVSKEIKEEVKSAGISKKPDSRSKS